MFELTTQSATLSSVNPRAEMHGDEAVPAVDLGLEFTASNRMLSNFGSRLLDSLYWQDKGAPGQQDLVAVDPVSEKPNLKNPTLDGALKVKYEGIGYTLVVDFGLGGASNIIVEGVDVNKVRVTPMEGGSVVYQLRVQLKNPDADTIGRLATLVGHEIIVSLEAPQADQQQQVAA